MIWISIMAAVLAYTTFRLGGYIMMVSIYTAIAQVGIIAFILGVIFWLVRRYVRSRRRKVRQIPRL